MEALTHKDWLRVQEVVLDLHSAQAERDLPARIVNGLRWVIPCDSASLQDDLGGARNVPWLRDDRTEWQAVSTHGGLGLRMMPSWGVEYLPFRPAWLAVSVERHPHTTYFDRTGDGSAKRLSTLISTRALRQTTFYNELSRPTGLRRQLTIYMKLSAGSTLTVAACRRHLEFSDRECSIMDALRPHVQLAWTRHAKKRADAAATVVRAAATDGTNLVSLGITKREAEVLRWVAAGKTNPEICIIMSLSASTVKTHVARLLAKLACENRTCLAAIALESRRES